MAKKVIALVSYLFLLAAFALAATTADSNAPLPAWIELRQYLTMAIVAVVCVVGGVILFFKTGHA